MNSTIGVGYLPVNTHQGHQDIHAVVKWGLPDNEEEQTKIEKRRKSYPCHAYSHPSPLQYYIPHLEGGQQRQLTHNDFKRG